MYCKATYGYFTLRHEQGTAALAHRFVLFMKRMMYLVVKKLFVLFVVVKGVLIATYILKQDDHGAISECTAAVPYAYYRDCRPLH